MTQFSHFDASGAARMVQVGSKDVTARTARAEGVVKMHATTLKKIQDRQFSKGDVCEVARLAGIMATKRTAELIPLCHSLALDGAEILYEIQDETHLRIESRVNSHGKTGVEMEALTAVSIAALTIYDMCKSVDRGMEIQSLRLLEKSGGKSGHFLRENEQMIAVNAQSTNRAH